MIDSTDNIISGMGDGGGEGGGEGGSEPGSKSVKQSRLCMILFIISAAISSVTGVLSYVSSS